MKKIILTLILFMATIFAQNTFAESIELYNVDILLHTDSSMDVVETINYNFGENQKHGIFRFIPLHFNVKGQKKWSGLKERKLDFSNLSVTRDGIFETFVEEEKDSNDNYFIKIGDPNITINETHQYQIHYTVQGSLRYFEDHDEVYWNAIGLDWEIPINNVEISLRAENSDIIFGDSSCYTGLLASNKQCTEIKFDSHVVNFTQSSLNPKEGLTISTALQEKGMVDKNELYSFTFMIFIIGGFSLLVSFVVGIIYSIRRYINRYKIYDPIYPRYEPPQGFSPVGVGYLVDKRFDSRDITAGIVSLAQRGFMSIEQIKSGFLDTKDYVFTPLKINEINKDDVIDQTFINLIFEGKNQPVKLSHISKSNALTSKQKLLTELDTFFVENAYIENLFKKNNWNFKNMTRIILIVIFFLFFPVLFFLMIPAFLIMYIFISKRYTKKGWEIKFAIEGFKDFLSMTEKDRYKFHNNPADNPQEFMEYLPYAIAMGVEKEWAKQFESLTMDNPSWYSGENSFNSISFVSQISSLNNSLSSATYSRSSSMSSSGSGSGGGGSSGGGSGGGGGGSW